MEAHTDTGGDDVLKKAVLSNADYLNKFLIFSVALLLTIIVLKFQKKPTFQLGSLEFDTRDSWLVVLALTIAHRILAGYFRGSINAFLRDRPSKQCKQLFDEITISGPQIFRGLLPKKRLRPDSEIYLLSLKDPTAWVYICSSLLIPIACVSLQHRSSYANAAHFAIAVYLLVWNWTIGSSWAILIGKLAKKEDISVYERLRMEGGYQAGKIIDMTEFNQLVWQISRSIIEVVFYLLGVALIAIFYYQS